MGEALLCSFPLKKNLKKFFGSQIHVFGE